MIDTVDGKGNRVDRKSNSTTSSTTNPLAPSSLSTTTTIITPSATTTTIPTSTTATSRLSSADDSSLSPTFGWIRYLRIFLILLLAWALLSSFDDDDPTVPPPNNPFELTYWKKMNIIDTLSLTDTKSRTGIRIIPSNSSSSTTHLPRINDQLTNILLIGDSVDLYFLMDWCRSNPVRSLCRYYPDGDRFRGPSYASRSTDNCHRFYDNMQRLPDINYWKNSYAPVWCHDPNQNITILMFWQNLGVYPVPPFHTEIIQFGHIPSTRIDMTVHTALRTVLEPILRDAPILFGGRVPDGILFQSTFWELFKLVSFHLPLYNDMRINEEVRIAWTTEWIRNMSVYTDILRELTTSWYPNPRWIGTRTANLVKVKKINNNEKNWRYDSTDVILVINRYLHSLATKQGIDIIDFETITGYSPLEFLRDDHHPLPAYMVTAMEAIVTKTLAAVKKDKAG